MKDNPQNRQSSRSRRFGVWLKSDVAQSLYSGLIPTAILVGFVIFELSQTREQLKLFGEQIAYERTPVVEFEIMPGFVKGSMGSPDDLIIHNIGNATAINVWPRLWLFLVGDSTIYSLTDEIPLRSYWSDTTRDARARVWPRLTLAPNQDFNITERLTRMYYQVVFAAIIQDSLIEDSELYHELNRLANTIGGAYIILAEVRYRRESDFVETSDTVYFELRRGMWNLDDVSLLTGGPAIVSRLREYLYHGPRSFISVRNAEYQICKELPLTRSAFGEWNCKKVPWK